MKKNYSFYSMLTAIPVGLLILVGFSGGQGGSFSGSPGDSGNTCTQCHAPSGANFGGTPNLTGFPTNYVPGQTYNLTLAISGSSSSKFGFNLTAEQLSNNAKAGTWTAGTGSQLRNNGATAGLTHTNAGPLNTWNVAWTAPATNVGDVVFYFATVQANNNGANSGDQVVTGIARTLLSTTDIAKANFKLFPTQVTNDFTLRLENSDTGTLQVFNLNGTELLKQDIIKDNTIVLANYAQGIYFVKVTVDGRSATERIIKL